MDLTCFDSFTALHLNLLQKKMFCLCLSCWSFHKCRPIAFTKKFLGKRVLPLACLSSMHCPVSCAISYQWIRNLFCYREILFSIWFYEARTLQNDCNIRVGYILDIDTYITLAYIWDAPNPCWVLKTQKLVYQSRICFQKIIHITYSDYFCV